MTKTPRFTLVSSRRGRAVPVPLPSREVVLLAHGMHPFARLWTFFALPSLVCGACYIPLTLFESWRAPGAGAPGVWSTLIMLGVTLVWLLFGFGPWLFSGRYWLTTRQVIWQPRLGRRRQLPLTDIQPDKLRAFSWTQSVQLCAPQRVSLRFVQNPAHLWGGVLLLQTPGLAAAIEAGSAASGRPVDAACLPHATCSAASGRAGQAVLTGEFVAFLPTDLQDHSIEAFVEAVFSILPYSPARTIYPELPLDVVLPRLKRLPSEQFSLHLHRLAAQYGGVYWRNDRATTFERRTARVSQYLQLRFARGDVTLEFSVAPSQIPTLEELLALWKM